MKRYIVIVALALVGIPAAASAQPNLSRELRDLRDGYHSATITQAQAGELIARLVFTHRAEGFGLLRKDGGNNCPVPNSPIRVSCDIVLHRPTLSFCDVLGDAPDPDRPGAAAPNWCATFEPGDMANFFAPPDPGGVAPPPPPPPPSTGVTRAEMDAAIHAAIVDLHTVLWNEVGGIIAEQRAVSDRRFDEVNARIDSHPIVDSQALAAAIDAALAKVVVSGKTRTAFGHQHVVELGVTRKQ